MDLKFGYTFERADGNNVTSEDVEFIKETLDTVAGSYAYGRQIMVVTCTPVPDNQVRNLDNYGLERVPDKTERFQTHPCGAVKIDVSDCPIPHEH